MSGSTLAQAPPPPLCSWTLPSSCCMECSSPLRPEYTDANVNSRHVPLARLGLELRHHRERLRPPAHASVYLAQTSTLAVAGSTSGPESSSTSLGRRVFTIDRDSSSCTSKTSASCRSYDSDQIWYPSAALMSCVVTRSRLPARRTLPSSTALTLSR